MNNLKVLDASYNRISGVVPDFLANGLQQLYLDHNNLTGPIPLKYGSGTPGLRCWSLDNNPGICGSLPMGIRCFNPMGTSIGEGICLTHVRFMGF